MSPRTRLALCPLFRSENLFFSNRLIHVDVTRLVAVGDNAPSFHLPTSDGSYVSLADFLGRKNLVVYFYPKDFTQGCTAEACSFRDSYEAFKDLGAEVIGISSDNQTSHRDFAQQHHLPFILLSDADGSVRKAYGVKKTLGLFAGRVSFVIDKKGIIRHVFSSQMRATAHVAEALNILKSIS
jgi:thioredoxin-dependent peroxiredoxin